MASFSEFEQAQDGVWTDVVAELRAGHKQSHWIWFVFPQLRALGRSGTAKHYGIASLQEARDYLAHPVLGARLLKVTRLVLAVQGRSLHAIFGSPDDLKFRSCMTLFAQAAQAAQQPEVRGVFEEAITRLCDGVADAATLDLLAAQP